MTIWSKHVAGMWTKRLSCVLTRFVPFFDSPVIQWRWTVYKKLFHIKVMFVTRWSTFYFMYQILVEQFLISSIWYSYMGYTRVAWTTRKLPTNSWCRSKYGETCLSWQPTVPETVVNISKWSAYTNVSQNNFHTRILYPANYWCI
jgi:hypothetical protein